MGLDKRIAVFLLYLVLSLTIVPALIYADFYSFDAAGSDGAQGFIKPTDTIKVTTQSILPVSVDFHNSGNYTLMNCDSNTPVTCTYSKSLSNASNQVNVAVKESGSLITQSKILYVDIHPPVIESAVFASTGNGVSASYQVRDSSGAQGKCSGIKKVELYLNNKLAATNNHLPGVCSITGVATGSLPNFEGTANTSIRVTDFMGYFTNKTGQGVTFESIPPKIISPLAVYKPGTDLKLASLPPGADTIVDVVMTVEEEQLDYASADFSSLHSSAGNKTADCIRISDNKLECRFSSVPVRLGGAIQRIVFTAKDSSGNTANLTTSLPVTLTPSKFTLTTTVSATGTGANITRIGGVNSTKPISIDATFTVSYDGVFDLQKLILETSQYTDSGASNTEGLYLNGTRFAASEPCQKSDDKKFVCLVKNLQARALVTTPKLTIYAIDEAGSVSSQQASLPLQVVNNAGTVNSLTLTPAEKCIGGTCYLNPSGQEASAVISQASSYTQNKVSINSQQATCTQGLNSWVCNATIPGATTIVLGGEDDFGHRITGQFNARIVIDPQEPKIASSITASPQCPTSKETMTIAVNASDAGGSPSLTISTNPQGLTTTNNTLLKQSCTPIDKQQGRYACTLKISNLIEEQINTQLEIKITDTAGNSITQNMPVSVCTASDETPDLIASIKTVGTLPRIDKKVASKIQLKMPVSLSINYANENVIILQRSPIKCSAPGVTQSYLINEKTQEPMLMLSVKYDKSWDENESLTISCTQDFKIRQGNLVFTKLETESFQFKIGLYNQPLGTISEAYTDKVTNIKKEIRKLDKRIIDKEKIDNRLGRICELAERMGRINSMLQGLKPIGYTLAWAFSWTGSAEAIWKAFHYPTGMFKGYVDKLIWPPGWVPTGANAPGLVVKTVCSIYHCKFYDANTYVAIGMSFALHKYRNSKNIKDLIARNEAEAQTYRLNQYTTRQAEVTQLLNDNPTGAVELSDRNLLANRLPDNRIILYYIDSSGIIINHAIISPVNPNTRIEITSVNNRLDFANFGRFEILPENPTLTIQPVAVAAPPPQGTSARSTLSIDTNTRTVIPAAPGQPAGATASAPQRARTSFQRYMARPQDQPELNSNFVMERAMAQMIEGSDGTWFVNPYKSKEHDKYCSPAQIFNAKKERELLCKKLGCFEQMKKSGGPLEACDFDFNYGYCLYVESARNKAKDDFGKNFGGGNFNAIMNTLPGLAVSNFYLFPPLKCIAYMSYGIDQAAINTPLAPNGWNEVVCAVWGAKLASQELLSYKSLGRDNSPTKLPVDATTYCDGVNYRE